MPALLQGAIQSVRVVKDETSGICTGTAYVKFGQYLRSSCTVQILSLKLQKMRGVADDALLAIQTICGNPLPVSGLVPPLVSMLAEADELEDGSTIGVFVKPGQGQWLRRWLKRQPAEKKGNWVCCCSGGFMSE